MPFPSPINPVFGLFTGGLEGSSFFEGSARVSPDSTAAIAKWMSDRPPPARSSFAFRFSRLACDLEYGRRVASISGERVSLGHRDTGGINALSSNLACLSILFSFFGVIGFEPASVEDNVSRSPITYGVFVTTVHDQ